MPELTIPVSRRRQVHEEDSELQKMSRATTAMYKLPSFGSYFYSVKEVDGTQHAAEEHRRISREMHQVARADPRVSRDSPEPGDVSQTEYELPFKLLDPGAGKGETEYWICVALDSIILSSGVAGEHPAEGGGAFGKIAIFWWGFWQRRFVGGGEFLL